MEKRKIVEVKDMKQLTKLVKSGKLGKCGNCGAKFDDEYGQAFMLETGTCPCCHNVLREVELKEEN